jgi:acyl carrier protein
MTQTSLESAIASIWADVLHVEGIALDQDFFELGGTSLHAARVVTKTRAMFEVKLSPRDLFEHSTLAAFAAQVDAARAPEVPR